MIVTNQTSADIYFGPLHLAAGVGQTLTVDDTTATSLYLTDDGVADALNNAYNAGKVTVSGQAQPFPRPTGTPQLVHGTGNPEGIVYAPQGSVYMRRDGLQTNGGVIYMKTTGVTLSTGWLDLATMAGVTAAIPAGTVTQYAGSAAPTGWLLCNGSAISRSTYATLFSAVGTTYGAGDGSTTFNLPDLRGRTAVGYFSGGKTEVATLGNNEGLTGANATKRNVKHSHSYALLVEGSGAEGTGAQGNQQYNNFNTSSDTDNPNAPAYLVVNYIIKT
jgi:microcystin-dependent protein